MCPFFYIPASLTALCQLLCEQWSSKHCLIGYYLIQREPLICGLNMNWALIPLIKLNAESNIRNAFVVMFHMGRNQEIVLTQLWKKNVFFFFAFCDEENDVLVFELFTRKGIFLLISWRHSFCVVVVVFFPFSTGLYKTWCDCVCLLCFMPVFVHTFSSLQFIKMYVYKNHKLYFLLNIHVWDCMNVFFSPFFWEKWQKAGSPDERCFVLFCFCTLTQKEIFFCW